MPEAAELPPTLRPTREELAVGLQYGPDPAAPPLPPARHGSIREAIEDVLREALTTATGPCVIAFSGGRDSSVLLALALHVARRDGLPEPLAFTDRYPHVPESLEDEWQESVARHLGLDPAHWLRIDRGHEHEVLGAQAQTAMRAHGVLLPGTWAAMGMPPEMGRGGTLVTGYGGDELFAAPERPVLSSIAAGRRPPTRRLHTLPAELLPRAARARLAARRASPHEMPWVRPAVRTRMARLEAADTARIPIRFDHLMPGLWADRDFRAGSATGALMAAESGARCVDPFADPRVMAAAARRYGRSFPRSRAEALHELAGHLLPPAVLQRRSKADFTRVFFGEQSRAWVESWDGSGADTACVDPAELRRALLADVPDALAVPSVQVAWLALDQAAR